MVNDALAPGFQKLLAVSLTVAILVLCVVITLTVPQPTLAN